MDIRWRLCESPNEDIINITDSCPLIFAPYYYLPLRHGVITKIVYNALINKKNIHHYQKQDLESPEYIYKEGNLEN